MNQYRFLLLTGILTCVTIFLVNSKTVNACGSLIPPTSAVCQFNTLCNASTLIIQGTDVTCNALCRTGGLNVSSCTVAYDSTWIGDSCICSGDVNQPLLNVTTTLNTVCATACGLVCLTCGYATGTCSFVADGLGVDCDCYDPINPLCLG